MSAPTTRASKEALVGAEVPPAASHIAGAGDHVSSLTLPRRPEGDVWRVGRGRRGVPDSFARPPITESRAFTYASVDVAIGLDALNVASGSGLRDLDDHATTSMRTLYSV